MIDYIKLKILNPPINELLKNELLDLKAIVNNKTGEIVKYIGYYKGLKFVLYECTPTHPYGLLLISGSFHKYFNNGKHNYNQFTKQDFIKVVNDLVLKFNLNPKDCIITNLEVGLNITPPIPTKQIIKHCLMHRKSPFKEVYTKDEGNYIQAGKQRYIIKIYDKQKHYKRYNPPNEIMRLELKFLKMINLHKQGIFTLQDLINFDFNIFKQQLLKIWNEILFYEPDTWDNTPYEYKYSNINYWNNLKPDNYKYHYKKIRKYKIHGLQNEIYQLLLNTPI